MPSTRENWFDISKGICILLVVVNHAGTGILKSGVGVKSSGWSFFHDFSYAFMVPVFFFFSGYFSNRSKKSSLAALKSLAARICYPYVLWLFLQFAVLKLSGGGNRNVEWNQFGEALLTGWMQFWFLHALIFIVLFDVAFKALKIPKNFRMLVAVAAYMGAYQLDVSVPIVKAFLTHLLYYEVGFSFTLLSVGKIKASTYWVTGFLGFLTVCFLELNNASYGTSLRFFAAIAGIFGVVSFAKLIDSAPRNRLFHFLSLCGQYSLQIYLTHVIFSAGIRFVLLKINLDSFAMHLLIGSIMGVIFPLVLAKFDAKYLGALFRFPVRREPDLKPVV